MKTHLDKGTASTYGVGPWGISDLVTQTMEPVIGGPGGAVPVPLLSGSTLLPWGSGGSMVFEQIVTTESTGFSDSIWRLLEDMHAMSAWDLPSLPPQRVRRVRARVRHRLRPDPLPFSLEDG